MDLKNLYRLSVFQKVVELGSFTQASTELRLSKSVVSQHVADLERDLRVRLLNRSTRSVSATAEGHQLAEAMGTMLSVVSNAVDNLEQDQQRPSGLIRMTASHNFGVVYLVDAIARFRASCPEVSVELDSNDSITNMIDAGYDVAFRIGWLKSTELHAIRLCDFEMLPCASAEHLQEYGPIASPLDLSLRSWVAITVMSDFDHVTLSSGDGREMSVKVTPTLRTNSGLIAKKFILGGNCVGLLPDYAVRGEIASGRLVRLLPEWRHRAGQISAIYVHRDRMAPRLRVFFEFLKSDAKRYLSGDFRLL
jgi:DNA-binding transcriptional LysR family regulator